MCFLELSSVTARYLSKARNLPSFSKGFSGVSGPLSRCPRRGISFSRHNIIVSIIGLSEALFCSLSFLFCESNITVISSIRPESTFIKFSAARQENLWYSELL
ncbi:unnamed protein product [Acanthoscelides obtectus]|uniref:Uncharacterized protein n=1 Tax=Acanthoscelides obtectus TaxID=200917 RepID=A0A9P0MC37_ACAOB|nr:unnamed protein product [Acanthoscelides obtectus]CAK1678378.1 hypothetical protein AOBTE_LOCUS31851 [Acanthoscelides obtectus]